MRLRDLNLLPLLPWALLPFLGLYVLSTMSKAGAGLVFAVPLLGLLALIVLLMLPFRQVAILTLGLIPLGLPLGFYRASHDFFFLNSAQLVVWVAAFVLLTNVVLHDGDDELVGPPAAATVLLALSLIPLANAGSWSVALSYTFSLLTGFLLMFVVVNLTRSTVIRGLQLLAGAATAGALTAIAVQAGRGGALVQGLAAFYSPNAPVVELGPVGTSLTKVARANLNSVHPNGYVVILMLCMVLGAAGILLSERGRLVRAALLAGYVSTLGVGAAMTLSRTGVVGILAAGLVALLMLIRRRRTRWLVIAGLLVVVVVAAVGQQLQAGGRLDTSALQSRFLVDDPASVNTFQFRLDLAADTFVLIRDNPFGIGYGSFGADVLSMQFTELTWINHAHNLFLQLAVEGGLALLAAFLWLCLVVVRRSFALWRSSSEWQIVGVLAVSGVTGLLVSGLGDADLVGDPVLMLLAWLVFALPFCRQSDDDADGPSEKS